MAVPLICSFFPKMKTLYSRNYYFTLNKKPHPLVKVITHLCHYYKNERAQVTFHCFHNKASIFSHQQSVGTEGVNNINPASKASFLHSHSNTFSFSRSLSLCIHNELDSLLANSLHIFSPPPTSSPVKLMFISSVALCTALMMKDFSKTPQVLTLAVSLLKPPYIYVVINSIILTLILISKLQQSFVFTRPATNKEGFLPAVDIQQPEFIYSYHANNVVGVEGDVVADGEPEEAEKESDTVLALLADKSLEEEMAGNSEMMVVSTESSLIPYHEKTLDSGRVGDHPELEDVESIVEDTRAMVPSKLKQHNTREQIWKKLSESQTMPTTRQKKKPDTSKSKTRGNVHGHVQVMKKHETFRNRTTTTFTKECCEQPKQLMWEDRSLWKLRKEPSLSQEELNVKVEAFINKFNEDMRLERQQSLNRHLDI